MRVLCAWLVALFSVFNLAQATEESYQFANEQERALFAELGKELRCPMCQNQNIADSDAMIARDLRRRVYELVREGQSREQILDFMKQRYGDFVHYQPPVTPVTMWLWLLPALFILLALMYLMMQRKPAPEEDEASKLARAEKLLEQDD